MYESLQFIILQYAVNWTKNIVAVITLTNVDNMIQYNPSDLQDFRFE